MGKRRRRKIESMPSMMVILITMWLLLASVTTSRAMKRQQTRCGVVTSRFAYFSGKPRWERRGSLSYALAPHGTPTQLSRAAVHGVLRRSFERWSAVIPMNFTRVREYSTADIKIGFFRGDHGDGEPFDGVLGVLAHAFSPRNGRLHLDGAESWAVDFKDDKSETAVDLESVVTHEIGHVLGLGHSSVKDAIMYPRLSPRMKKVNLHFDDVRGVQALYGSNPNFNLISDSDHSTTTSPTPSTPAFALILIFAILIFPSS